MNRIPPLVLEEARKIKDLPFERLIVFNHDCNNIFATRDGNALGVPLPVSFRSQVFGMPTLHNHPLLPILDKKYSSAIPSIGDVIGANHYRTPVFYVCDRDKITRTILAEEISIEHVQLLQHINFFGCSFAQSPVETIQEIRDVLSHIKLDLQLFDINTLQSRNDFVTIG